MQYNCIPHYRARIFELLSANKNVEFTIVADNNSDTPFLKTVTTDDNRAVNYINAKNYLIKVPGLADLYWQPEALRLFLKQRPDVLIALGSPYSFTAWSLVILGRVFRIPILLWGHGLLGDESGPRWWVRKLLYKLAAGQLLYGEYAKNLLVKKGFRPETLHVVYNSLDYDEQLRVAGSLGFEDIAGFRNKLGVAEGQGLVVFTGRLQPIKRLDMLVEAAGRLSERGKIIHIALVGEGTEKEKLAEVARKYGILNNLHFLGVSYEEEYLGLVLSAADLCVIPSGGGLSIMHAMVFGTPVLLHDRLDCHFPEWEAVKEGVTGFFYRYDDIDDLADKMEKALFLEHSKEKMSDECRQVIAEKYNPHRQVERFIDAVKRSIS